VTVTDLYVNSFCRVTEVVSAGATSTTVNPAGLFEVTADSENAPVTVTVTNQFEVGSLLVTKRVDGAVTDSTRFEFRLACELVVDGEATPVELPEGGVFTLSEADVLTRTFEDLPTGATCTLTETDGGGADDTLIEPGEVTIGSGTTVEIVATNRFDPPPPIPQTGSDADLMVGVVGLSLFLLGGMILLIAWGVRRRG